MVRLVQNAYSIAIITRAFRTNPFFTVHVDTCHIPKYYTQQSLSVLNDRIKPYLIVLSTADLNNKPANYVQFSLG